MDEHSATDQSQRIVYVLAIEDIVQSPLIRSQVFALLKVLAALSPGCDLHVVALYPIHNAWRFRAQVRALRIDLGAAGITLHVLPILFATRYFYIPRNLLPLFFVQGWLAAQWIAGRLQPAVIHCRSYPATWVGMQVKRQCGARLIFDTRALYPEEGKSRKLYGKEVMFDAPSFQIWKRLESQLVHAADVITSVSQPSTVILRAQYPAIAARLAVLPTITRTTSFERLLEWRAQTRADLYAENELVVIYIGSWVDHMPLLTLFQNLISSLPDKMWHLVLLLTGKASETDIAISASNVRCTILSLPQEQVLPMLAGADLAIQVVQAPPAEQLDTAYLQMAQTILSVKFTEYLAAGLPVLISHWHGAAADLVQRYDLGLVYDEASPETLTVWLARWQTEPEDFRRRAWDFARANFAIEHVARRYLALYHGENVL